MQQTQRMRLSFQRKNWPKKMEEKFLTRLINGDDDFEDDSWDDDAEEADEDSDADDDEDFGDDDSDAEDE